MGLTSKTLAAALGMINKDHDQSCVMAAIDALNDILKSFRGIGLQNKEFIDLIANAAHDLFLEKVTQRYLLTFTIQRVAKPCMLINITMFSRRRFLGEFCRFNNDDSLISLH